MSIVILVSESRNNVLNALKPIEELSNDKGITVLLEKIQFCLMRKTWILQRAQRHLTKNCQV